MPKGGVSKRGGKNKEGGQERGIKDRKCESDWKGARKEKKEKKMSAQLFVYTRIIYKQWHTPFLKLQCQSSQRGQT